MILSSLSFFSCVVVQIIALGVVVSAQGKGSLEEGQSRTEARSSLREEVDTGQAACLSHV